MGRAALPSHRRRAAGSPWLWARDLGVVGASTSGLVSWAVLVQEELVGFPPTAAVIGGLSGVLLGLVVPVLFDLVHGRLPPLLLLGLGVLLGGLWGGFTGIAAGIPSTEPMAPVLGAWFGGAMGAVQLGWLWPPYLLQRIRGQDPVALVAVAVALLPFIAPLGIALAVSPVVLLMAL